MSITELDVDWRDFLLAVSADAVESRAADAVKCWRSQQALPHCLEKFAHFAFAMSFLERALQNKDALDEIALSGAERRIEVAHIEDKIAELQRQIEVAEEKHKMRLAALASEIEKTKLEIAGGAYAELLHGG